MEPPNIPGEEGIGDAPIGEKKATATMSTTISLSTNTQSKLSTTTPNNCYDVNNYRYCYATSYLYYCAKLPILLHHQLLILLHHQILFLAVKVKEVPTGL